MAFSYSESEADFVKKVKSDLTGFVEISSLSSVLVFPPVNGFYRFLIHQLAQDNFEQLRTFSIGEDPDRRIVVCTKALVARIDAEKDELQPSLKTPAGSSQLTMVVSDAERSDNSQVRKSRSSLPTVGIYRPPAARRLTEGWVNPVSPASDPVIKGPSAKHAGKPARPRVRRPDQQVYVPRAKRAFHDSEKFDDALVPPVEDQSASRVTPYQLDEQQSNEKTRSRSNLIIEDRKPFKQRSSSPTGTPPSLPPRASQLVEIKKKLCQSTSSDLDLEGIESSIPSESGRLSTTMNAAQSVSLPPRAEVLVEKKKKLCQTDSVIEDYKWNTSEEDANLSDQKSSAGEVNPELSETGIRLTYPESKDFTLISDSEISPVIDIKVTNTSSVTELEEKCDILQIDSCPQNNDCRDTVVTKQTSEDSEPVDHIKRNDAKDAIPTVKCSQGCDSSDDDFQDAHNEKPNGLSDRSSSGSSESISSSDSVNASVTPVQLIKPVKIKTPKKTSPSKAARIFNPDECDWDALLDEDGEVLDPFLMKELTSAVGEVQVTQPKCDYRNYRSQVPADQPKTRRSTSDEDFGHVVEIFSFPPEFKTNDLVAVFSPFKNSGFEIKWVDDTHALGVFASALVAEQVLAYQHPMIRTRPLCDGTLESRLKARRLSESIQSFRPRPETCAALARRLVTGALGVKLATARQEREEEKRVLKEAREKRKLAAQQRDDIWNSG